MDDRDLTAMKEGVKALWGFGDYREIARRLEPDAEALVEAAGVSAGQDVLDVATGTGNVAFAAAGRGATVVGSDLAPQMLEWARARQAENGLPVEWREADVEALPFADASFDVVCSAFGAQFAPRPDVTARELFRVARPGGVVAMTNWAPDGFSGRASAVIASFAPAPPMPLPEPQAWGDEAIARERLGPLASDIRTERRAARFPFDSLEDATTFWLRNIGGSVVLEGMLDEERAAAYRRAFGEVVRTFATPADRGVVVESAYLLVVARKP